MSSLGNSSFSDARRVGALNPRTKETEIVPTFIRNLLFDSFCTLFSINPFNSKRLCLKLLSLLWDKFHIYTSYVAIFTCGCAISCEMAWLAFPNANLTVTVSRGPKVSGASCWPAVNDVGLSLKFNNASKKIVEYFMLCHFVIPYKIFKYINNILVPVGLKISSTSEYLISLYCIDPLYSFDI